MAGHKRTSQPTNTTTPRPVKRAKTETVIETFGPDMLRSILAFLQPKDALNLSSASPALDAAIDKSVWRYVLLEQCGVEPTLLKPRTQLRKKVVGLVEKKSCHHCGHIGRTKQNLYMIKVFSQHHGKKLCGMCIQYPMYHEIGLQDARRRFKVAYSQLRTLPVRHVSTGKMLNLQHVLDLVASG
ncbi:hypothetical protein SPRG_16777 [Saprolegnia parasitica CBS 223.65]|uniref:F-box domain-containing protein n=1 Tax=Saprolegnia parasitica (strain CBS 223.65) TaxID=695850 RepID=A0A067BHF6_SAPPC|nr:hypothetical protein SPRG_16777 [Saprolegnia parasitica CBS 223.65]KDO17814.1 hypothetical protein SPRG_16777 [Saprolegnia parasitica CBS 223.65]|eukprot:XP_012211479.1 hypothetical protein SPRG_16777 [Saprolegnia parasitica CBS 223.65]